MIPLPAAARRSAADGSIVCCVVGQEQYAIHAAEVRSVARTEQMRPVDGDRGQVGTLRDAGKDIPVYDLAARLGRPSEAGGLGHVVVTGGWREPVGWLVDRVVRTARHDGSGVLALPPAVGSVPATWFEGLLKLDDRFCLVISPSGLDPRNTDRAFRRTGAEAPAAPPQPGGAAAVVVIFPSPALPSCGSARYAISARQVAAVLQSLPAIPVPGSARHISGLAWWRDRAVPVVDFGDRGARAFRAGRTRYLLVRCGARFHGSVVALPIQPDVSLHRAADCDRPVDDPSARPGFVVGTFGVGGEHVALLDIDALLTERTEL